MNLTIISGSHRLESQSLRISEFLKKKAESLGLFGCVDILDLGGNPLPLWDPSIFSGSEEWKTLLAPWRETLKKSDAVIIVAPEWNGMVPAALKNFFLLFGSVQLGHKPGLIVGVSAGAGGSYPVVELRSSSYKNCRLCYLPEHLIVRDVASRFVGEDSEQDQELEGRAEYCLKLLKEYAVGLKSVRDSGVVDHKTYRNGM